MWQNQVDTLERAFLLFFSNEGAEKHTPTWRYPSHIIHPTYSLRCYIYLRWFIFQIGRQFDHQYAFDESGGGICKSTCVAPLALLQCQYQYQYQCQYQCWQDSDGGISLEPEQTVPHRLTLAGGSFFLQFNKFKLTLIYVNSNLSQLLFKPSPV